jgi:predicted DNA-binding transcriptional regulator AlpA
LAVLALHQAQIVNWINHGLTGSFPPTVMLGWVVLVVRRVQIDEWATSEVVDVVPFHLGTTWRQFVRRGVNVHS